MTRAIGLITKTFFWPRENNLVEEDSKRDTKKENNLVVDPH